MDLTSSLKTEYRDLWKSCSVRPSRLAEVDALVDRIAAHKPRYTAAGKPHGVPWHVVGIIHMLEGSGNFATHLHNGDPLTKRTVQVPKGRPVSGRPPFTWEQSAEDALVFDGLAAQTDWSIAGTLFAFERFNGFGYRPKGIRSPYLWSFSNHYSKGKFVRDGVFSTTAVSAQCGAAVLLSRMVARKLTTVKGAPTPVLIPVDDGGILEKGAKGPAVKQLKTLLKRWFDATSPGEWATLKVAPNDVFGEQLRKTVRLFQARVGIEVDGQVGTDTMGALKAKPSPLGHVSVPELVFPAGLKVGVVNDTVHLVQGWLTLHGFAVVVDGKFLPATEKALRKFQQARGLPVTGVLDRATWAQLTQPMNAALAPIHGVKPLGGLSVAYAHQHSRQKPREVGGENRGPWVRLYTGNEGKDMLWCAGFATFVLKQACTTLGVPMPIRQTLLCDEMASSAGSRFVKGGTTAAIRKLKPGSFFLRRAGPGEGHKYSHTGIIARPEADTMDTIEGNTNDDGSSNGIEVLERTRGYSNMDFIVI